MLTDISRPIYGNPYIPHWLTSVLADGDHAIFYVCQAHADEYALTTSDSCLGGCVCHVRGCGNETSLVHYLWDHRPEIVQQRKVGETAVPDYADVAAAIDDMDVAKDLTDEVWIPKMRVAVAAMMKYPNVGGFHRRGIVYLWAYQRGEPKLWQMTGNDVDLLTHTRLYHAITSQGSGRTGTLPVVTLP